MPKKSKAKRVQSLPEEHHLATTHSVFNLPKAVEQQSKIQEKDVFEGYKKKTPEKKSKSKSKVPKGSHRMPDGSIMKDSDMKKKSKTKRSKKKVYRNSNRI